MKRNLKILILAIKYWLEGDDWWYAMKTAERLVKGWKR